MNDIHMDDPRKFSAKQKKSELEQAKKIRTFWQYLFDLFVKTLILAAIFSLDFTLIANAGNYNLFSSALRVNFEAECIYAAILAVSFAIMFIVSFFRKLENVVIALAAAITGLVVINQFATFEKRSGLLIFLGSFLDDTANAILYEYSFWIIGAAIFLIVWIFLSSVKRSVMFYSMLSILAVLAWVLSEAYLNTSVQYFRTAASSPAFRSETAGKNLVFLSFNSLTSPNNIRNMYKDSRQKINIQAALNNVMGFYMLNDFTVYPNALVKDANNPFFNLVTAYNPDSEQEASSHLLSSAIRDDYFNFSALQSNRLYLKDSSFYEMLRKNNYTINVFQTRDIDSCYLNNKLAVASCKEKVNYPISLNGNTFSAIEKIVLLTAQWLNSTGFVPSVNPILQIAELVYSDPALKPLNFEVNNLYAINSFKVLDQIVESIDNHNGNQAYFAIIDLPSETYVYDEFCQLKPMPQWISEKNSNVTKVSTESKRIAYSEQVSCLYGYLEKFIQQLDKGGLLENTTIVIEGLNTPQGLGKPEQDYYRQLQSKNQAMFAIRLENASTAEINYSVCQINDILNSFFFTHKPCEELKGVKTTDKNMKIIRSQIEQDKYDENTLKSAVANFKEWFMAWTAHNQFQSNFTVQTKEDISIETPKVIKEAPVAENTVKDVPEQKMKSIKAVAEEVSAKEETLAEPAKKQSKADKQTQTKAAPQKKAQEPAKQDIIPAEPKAQDVIPETILDDTPKKQPEQNAADDAIARAKKAVQQKNDAKAELAKLPKDTVVVIKDDTIRNILEAPVAEGQKLSPEELKKQYRQNLQKDAPQTEERINIKVNLIEN